MKYRQSTQILLLLLTLSSAPAAFAYLDPGTGSALLQGILGALAAAAVVIKLYWYRLLRLLGLRKKPPVDTSVQPSMSTDDDNKAGQRTERP